MQFECLGWNKLHPFEILSVEGQALTAPAHPVLHASPPLCKGDLSQFSLNGSMQSVQIRVLSAAQFALQIWEQKKSQGDKSGE